MTLKTSLLAIPAICLGLSTLAAQDSDSSSSSGGDSSSSETTSSSSSSSSSNGVSTGDSGGSSFSLPGGLGFFPKNLTSNEGRFTQPPFRVSASLYNGYDSNPNGSSGLPGTPAVKGSGVTNVSVGLYTQLHSKRWALTLDLTGGGFFYWNGIDPDYTAGLNLSYAYAISPRAQFSAQIASIYQSQPDYSLITSPTGAETGDFLSTTSKFDLSYQWTPRWETISSYSFNELWYRDSALQGGDYIDNLFGQQLRYILSPRIALVGEYRYEYVSYQHQDSADSSSNYILGGFDWNLSRRLLATVRAGAEIRDYNNANSSTDTQPFVETTAQYAYGKHSSIQWNTRYGFEEGAYGNSQRKAFRTGLGINQGLTPRLTANLGAYYVHGWDDAQGGGFSETDDNYQVTAGLQYALSRHLTLGANYTYTTTTSSVPTNEYDRQRVFVGADFSY